MVHLSSIETKSWSTYLVEGGKEPNTVSCTVHKVKGFYFHPLFLHWAISGLYSLIFVFSTESRKYVHYTVFPMT